MNAPVPAPIDPVARIRAAYARIAQVDRPEIWITLRPEADVLALAEAVAERVANQGEDALPLAGQLIAVKDNIDVAGLPTTSALPSSAYTPSESATAVARLEAAGAIVLGKTNLDQLATGLVGARSPYGAVRAAHDPTKISGGSSSGSAVAVAFDIVDASLGTDTAGSGRVPAAFNGLIGIKPTLGLVPSRGMVPAAPSYDTITVFAKTLYVAELVAGTIVGSDQRDHTSRSWPSSAALTASPNPRIAVPGAAALEAMTPSWRKAFQDTLVSLERSGATLVEVDIAPLLAAAKLLYDGALVAERTHAVGHLLEGPPEGADPSVAAIIGGGAAKSAVQLVSDQQTLRRAKLTANAILTGVDALAIPTAPGHPTLDEVAADPIPVNSWVGTYTNFVNLLDLAAIAIPGEKADGEPFGITLVGPAFSDAVLVDLARRYLLPDDARGWADPAWGPQAIRVAVFGAHMTGQPLNPQLTDIGAKLLGPVTTAPQYRFYALDTQPPKPGLVHVDHDGASITGELWAIPAGQVGSFLAQLARPMVVGKVELMSGDDVLGFLCEPAALNTAEDITALGSWIHYLDHSPAR